MGHHACGHPSRRRASARLLKDDVACVDAKKNGPCRGHFHNARQSITAIVSALDDHNLLAAMSAMPAMVAVTAILGARAVPVAGLDHHLVGPVVMFAATLDDNLLGAG